MRGKSNVEGNIPPAPDVATAGEPEDSVTEGGGLELDVKRCGREELFGMEEMDGSAVDANPYGAVAVDEEGSFVRVVGDEAILFGDETPVGAVEDVDAEICTDPEPAAMIESDDLDIGGDEVRS